MKRRKIIAPLFAIAAVLLFVFQGSLTVSAAGNTYVLHYDGSEGEWFYQSGSAWDKNADDRELYYLQQEIKDGDLIVVDNSGDPIRLNAHLANLTILHNAYAVVYTNGIDDCYLLEGSTSSINGEITNAYLYDGAAVTLNNNVNNLYITSETVHLYVDVYAEPSAAVAHVRATGRYGIFYECYDVAPGKLEITEGRLETDEMYYSKTPSATTSLAAPAQKPASGEYDDVPKTGESAVVYWLLGIAVVCLAGRYALRKVA